MQGEMSKDLALELMENSLAKYVNMMENDAKLRLKAIELQAKKTQLKMWTSYVPPATSSKATHDFKTYKGALQGKFQHVIARQHASRLPYHSPCAYCLTTSFTSMLTTHTTRHLYFIKRRRI